jgi:hypothetical protein
MGSESILKARLDVDKIATALARLEGWMKTYFLPPFDGSGGIGGPVATYWASSPYMAGPYVINSYGSIRGLCKRARDPGSEEVRIRAERFAEYYLRTQDPTTGLFVCSWGETPFAGFGLIQQSSVVAALWDLYQVWPNSEVSKAAQRGWIACLKHPSIRRLWSVHNQALRACEALILGIQARGGGKPSPEEAALLRRCAKQVANEQLPRGHRWAGALPQSLADDRIILPYQGDCLAPLVMLSNFLHDQHLLDIAQRLADFILHTIDIVGGEPFIPGTIYPLGKGLLNARRLYRLRYISPFFEPALRGRRRRYITDWRFVPWPRWIARTVDTARGLWKLSDAIGDSRYARIAGEMLQAILQHQSPLGGVRNSLGFFGQDPREKGGLSWQDVVPNPRWNSYIVQFLHEILAGTPVHPPQSPTPDCRDEVRLAGGRVIVETVSSLTLLDVEGDTIWVLRKGMRWGRPFRQVTQWDEGGAVKE